MLRKAPKRKKCECGYEGYFIGKKCRSCHARAMRNKQRANYKPTGELALFQDIWKQRPHFSEVSGKPLPGFNVACFSHILDKKNYPQFRLNPDNIMLKTLEEHNQYERERYKLKDNPMWAHVFEKREKLKSEYPKK